MSSSWRGAGLLRRDRGRSGREKRSIGRERFPPGHVLRLLSPRESGAGRVLELSLDRMTVTGGMILDSLDANTGPGEPLAPSARWWSRVGRESSGGGRSAIGSVGAV